MSQSGYENDELIFLDEDGSEDIQTYYGAWNILIVDDDEEID